MKLSIVIPLYNEEKNLSPLYSELKEVLEKVEKDHEIVFINDGSTDSSIEVLNAIKKKDKRVKVLSIKKNKGKSYALTYGFSASLGKYIIQMDADLQDDPKYIPEFINRLDNGLDMVIGVRRRREDGIYRNLGSKSFNFFVNLISPIKLSDHNSGFKGYKSKLAKGLSLHSGMHRYITVIASSKGFKIGQIEVIHRKRRFGKSKYGYTRIIEAIIDYFRVITTSFQ